MILTPERIRRLPQRDKLIPYDEMGGLVRRLRAQDAPVYLAQGVYDLVHLGHVGFIRAAHNLNPNNGIVVVGVESDASVRRNKGSGRPINTESERAALLTEFVSAHLVVVYQDNPDYNRPEDFIRRYRHLRPTAIIAPTWDPHIGLKEQQAAQAGTAIAQVVYHYENSTTRMLREVGYE